MALTASGPAAGAAGTTIRSARRDARDARADARARGAAEGRGRDAWNRARAVIAVGSTTREAATNDDNRQLGTRENLTSEKGGRDES
tara:strand:- start:1288 stop:1548 length:261 start_codon:yes stop_codon:yes gene_type:complete